MVVLVEQAHCSRKSGASAGCLWLYKGRVAPACMLERAGAA